MKSVLISTPAYTGGVHAAYASAFGQTMLVLRNAGIAATPLFTVGESNINRERNRHLAEFLMNPEYTHLFIIDGDIAWNPYDALRILASPHEVTCSVYRVKGEPLRWAANFDAPMDMRDGYVLTRDAPTGFMCVRRPAILRMIHEYPELRCKLNGGTWMENAHCYALFDSMIDDDGAWLSEDFGFCRRWQRLGGEVWALADVTLAHYEGKRAYTGRLLDSLVGVETADARTPA